MTPQTVDFVPKAQEETEERPNVKVLIGAMFLIEGFEVHQGKSRDDGKTYEWAAIKTNVGSYRTSTMALIEQLREMEALLKAGKQVRVKLTITGGKPRFTNP